MLTGLNYAENAWNYWFGRIGQAVAKMALS